MADAIMTELEVKTEDLSKTPEKDGRVMSPDTPGSGLRRSTRASAIRAAEKLKGADSGKMEVSPNSTTADDLRDEQNLAEALVEDAKLNQSKEEPAAKKRKLADTVPLDPTDPHFAIQENDDGDVVVLSDDSEVSSLNEEELGFIRTNYEKIACGELTDEQRVERERMIRQLKAELRCEEAKLLMLKKMKLSQQAAHREPTHAHNNTTARAPGGHMPPLQRGTAPTAATGHQQAYRPPIANPQVVNRHPTALPGQRQQPPPLTQVRGNIPNRGGVPGSNVRPGVIPAAHSTGRTTGLTAAGFNNRPHPGQHTTNTPPMSKPLSTSSPMDTQTAAQKQAAAKLALRKQLEKTLLQIPAPKPPPPEMHFTPNPNQPDFVYMVGLDYCVQRLEQLKESKNRKAAAAAEAAAIAAAAENGEKIEVKPKRISPIPTEENPGDPYVCAQCGIDFTPFWKAVGDENKPKIMCESCVRSNQKKALKAEHTNRLKQAFVKALQQEQEIDQQIKAGTFNLASITTTPSGVSSTPKSSSMGSSGMATGSSSRSAAHQQSASAAASLQANLANMAAAGFPHQMFGFNPLMAAAARFPGGFGSFSGGNPLFPNVSMQNLPKDYLKSLNRAAEQQRQILMDMMPRAKFPHK